MAKTSTPIWKTAATTGGTALTSVAVWMNAQHIAHAEGWGSPLVAAGVIVTLCAEAMRRSADGLVVVDDRDDGCVLHGMRLRGVVSDQPKAPMA